MLGFDFTGTRYTKDHLSKESLCIITSDRSPENTAALKYILSNNQRITEVSFKLENSAGVTRWFKDEIEELLKNKDSLEVLSFISESYDQEFLAAIHRIIEANTNLKSLTNFRSFHAANPGFTAQNFMFFFNNFPLTNSIESLDISFSALGDGGAIALAGALQRNLRIQRLNLCQNRMTAKGAVAIAGALKDNKALKKVDVAQDNLGDMGGVAFAELLRENNNIVDFRIAHCEIGTESVRAFGKALQCEGNKIQNFELSAQHLDDESAHAIALGLRANTTLRSLALYFGTSSSKELSSICEALEANTTIRTLKLGFDLSGNLYVPVANMLRKNRSIVELKINNCGLNDDGFRGIQESVSSNESSRLHSLAIELPSVTPEMATVLERFATSGRRNVCSIAFQNHRLHINQFQAFHNNYLRSDWVKRLKRIFEANPSFRYEYGYRSDTPDFKYDAKAKGIDQFYENLLKDILRLRSMFLRMRWNEALKSNIYISPSIQEVYTFPYTIASFAKFLAGGYARLRFELFKKGVCSWEEAEDLVKNLSEIMPHIFYRDVILYGLPEKEKRRQFVVYMNDSINTEKQHFKIALPSVARQFFSDHSVQEVCELIVYRQNLENAGQAKTALANMTMEQVTEEQNKLVLLEQRSKLISKCKPYVVLTLKILAATAIVYCVIRSSKINFRELLANWKSSNALER